jgi:hypothetical protein
MAMATSPAPIPAVELVYSVPVGAVIAWYPPGEPNLPRGFALCDGNIVDDDASPFNGRRTPDLCERFILGASARALLGTAGGDPDFAFLGFPTPELSTTPTQSSGDDDVPNNLIERNNPTPEGSRYVLTDNGDGWNDGNHHHELPFGAMTIPPPAWTALLYIIRIK